MKQLRPVTASLRWNQDTVLSATIRTLSHLVPGCLVIYASTPSGRGAQSCLALVLLRALGKLDARWCFPHAEETLTLQKGTLGKPCLFLDHRKGPSVSFSHGKGRLWGAMSSKGRVGIDVAYPEEFAEGYPFARAFRPEELEFAGALCRNDTARGAALIWSAKEAAVKATGAGFNRFDPLDVRVAAPFSKEQGFLFDVLADRPITAWAKTKDTGWLAVALA